MTARIVRSLQLVLALLGAGLLALTEIPELIDDVAFVALSRSIPRPVSGEVVLVNLNTNEAVPDLTSAQRMARAIDALRPYRPAGIFLEGSFARDDAGVAQLQQAVAATDAPVTVAWPLTFAADSGAVEDVIDRRARLPGAREALDSNLYNVTGFIWEGEYAVEIGDRVWPVFGAAIAGVDQQPGIFQIDYRYDIADFPSLSYAALIDGQIPRDIVEGRRVVISTASANMQNAAKIPGHWRVPTVMVAMLAAETLVQGAPRVMGWPAPLLLVAMLLLLGTTLPTVQRRIAYGFATAVCLLLPFHAAASADIFLHIGPAWVLLMFFAALRLRTLWRERAASIDKISGLPNFNALANEFVPGSGRLIVARVEGFDEIIASLETRQHKPFVRQIAERLSIGQDVTAYTDGTGHFAWFDRRENATSHLRGLSALAAAPIRVGDRTLDFACSFGIHDPPVGQIRQALSATVVAAENAAQRKTRIAFVSELGTGDANWRLALHASLDEAIAREQIYLVYQPQCELDSGRIVGAEALVRWRHPERGEISPGEFIPQIENAGRLKPLTAHVIRLASRTAAMIGTPGLRVSANVSATLVSDEGFVAFICENVAAGGAEPRSVMVEITETARIDDHQRAAHNLAMLREHGFHVSLDDFGTGEANLSMLVALPCDEIKIDRSFIRLAVEQERARHIILALADTARRSRMRLVAEGIETEAEREMLLGLKCRIGQGFLLRRPMTAEELIQLTSEQRNVRTLQQLRLP